MKNTKAARHETLKFAKDNFDSHCKTASELQGFILRQIRKLNKPKINQITLQKCFLDARSEYAWLAMNEILRTLVKLSTK